MVKLKANNTMLIFYICYLKKQIALITNVLAYNVYHSFTTSV
jgi:hypothetical protein